MFQLQNQQAIKKYAFDMLQGDFAQHEAILDRLSYQLMLPNDVNAFTQLMASLYGAGYNLALGQCKEQVEKLGYKITMQTKDSNR